MKIASLGTVWVQVWVQAKSLIYLALTYINIYLYPKNQKLFCIIYIERSKIPIFLIFLYNIYIITENKFREFWVQNR